MKTIVRINSGILLSLFCLLLTACQPIQPVAQGDVAASTCTDEMKIALFEQQTVNVFDKGDVDAGTKFFANDGSLIVDAPPVLNSKIGKYEIRDEYAGKGVEILRDMVRGSFETGVKVTIDNIRIEDGAVVAEVTLVGPWYRSMGTPTDTAHAIHTVKFNQDCKAQEYTARYPEEFVQSLSEK